MNISSHFFESSKKHPNRIAIIDNEIAITYDSLSKDVMQTAAYFKKKGIVKGDRVLVFVPMSTDLYRIVLALFSIGATVVFLDEWVSKKRMEICCEIADCKGFIGVFKARVFSLFSRELRKIPIKLSVTKRLNELVDPLDMEPNDSALITFTTGSVGRPKAANRTHSFLNEQFMAVLDEIEPTEDDIDLPLLPIVFLVNLGIGCTSIVGNVNLKKGDKIELKEVVKQFIKYDVNRFSSSPFFVTKLAQYLINHSISLPQLEKIFTGGAPVFPKEAELYTKAFPNAKIQIVYGSTEVDPISSIEANELECKKEFLHRGLPVGKIVEKATVKIVNIVDAPISISSLAELNMMTKKEGEIGEIIVSGPHVLKSYYNSEDAFKENKIVANNVIWHRTGDSGFLLNDELFLTGRCKELIHFEDEVISPFIVENQLNETENVNKGTLLNVDGEIILCLETELSISKVESMTTNIQKNTIRIIENIPMDPRHNSKIDYSALRVLLKQN